MSIQDNIFTTVIQASLISKLPSHTAVYNAKDINDIICIKFPLIVPRDYQLASIYDLNSDKELDFDDFVTRDENRPWIDINSSILDLTPGQHVYRMILSKPDSRLTATCWFSYIIQDNFPEKPYIYMDRDEDNPDSSSSDSSN
jgi:hypothetical protein